MELPRAQMLFQASTAPKTMHARVNNIRFKDVGDGDHNIDRHRRLVTNSSTPSPAVPLRRSPVAARNHRSLYGAKPPSAKHPIAFEVKVARTHKSQKESASSSDTVAEEEESKE
jgi:hypothetical protein